MRQLFEAQTIFHALKPSRHHYCVAEKRSRKKRRKFIELCHLIRAVNILRKRTKNDSAFVIDRVPVIVFCLLQTFFQCDIQNRNRSSSTIFFCAVKELKTPKKLQPETVIVSKHCVSQRAWDAGRKVK
jgi:hypothetical protein